MTQRTHPTAYESGYASPEPMRLRSDQWLYDQHRNCLRMVRVNPNRREWYAGRRDAIRAEIEARRSAGTITTPQELDR